MQLLWRWLGSCKTISNSAPMKTPPTWLRASSNSTASLVLSSVTGARVPRKHKSASERTVNRTRSSWANSERTQSGRRLRSLSFSSSLVSSKARSTSGTGTCSASSPRTRLKKRAAHLTFLATSRPPAIRSMPTDPTTKTALCRHLTPRTVASRRPDQQQTCKSSERSSLVHSDFRIT